jgi:ribosomal protein S12 methylthiotransferase accessory factor
MSSAPEHATTDKRFTRGTHRLVSPDQTLALIEPHLLEYGITRWTDVTWLDRIGIPVYCGIRPMNWSIEVSNGKGLTPLAAKVSCLMEAIEVAHWDSPPTNLRRASWAQLSAEGKTVVPPPRLPDFVGAPWFDDRRVVEWVEGEAIRTGQRVWLPASAVYLLERPLLFISRTNGLASGNSVPEATLHALYEILERHLVSQAIKPGGELDVVDLSTIQDDCVGELMEKIARVGLRLVLLSPSPPPPLPVFIAVLLDPTPLALPTHANQGFGAHLSRSVAATRAITEAAQGRGTLIHGAREDLPTVQYEGRAERTALYDLFSGAEPNADWNDFPDKAGPTFADDLRVAFQCVEEIGLGNAYRVDMTLNDGIHVVRVLVEGASWNHGLV